MQSRLSHAERLIFADSGAGWTSRL